MTKTLLELALHYANEHADRYGVADTPFPGMAIFRQNAPGQLVYAVSKPLVAIVLQGAKRVTVGSETFDYGSGQSLLIGADLPNASQVMRATAAAPYVSLVIILDQSLIENLITEMGAAKPVVGPTVRIESTDSEVAEAAQRLLGLLERPSAIPILASQLIRELHFWLLAGRHGPTIRNLGLPDSHSQRIARAVALIRANLDKPLRVEQLADAAGMSPSSFHGHFRDITSLSPIQYQKQLRLIEARRMMLADGHMVSHAAHAVGYESVPQFTREYGRMFGFPPAQDVKIAKGRVQEVA